MPMKSQQSWPSTRQIRLTNLPKKILKVQSKTPPPYSLLCKLSISYKYRLSSKLLNIALIFPRHKRQRHNTRNMHLRSKDVHIELEFFAYGFDVLESFLVIGSRATDPDLYFVLD